MPKHSHHQSRNTPVVRGETGNRKVLGDAELPKLGGGEPGSIDVVVEGE